MNDRNDTPFGAPVDEQERRMALLTAYALEQLELADRVEAERLLASDADGSLSAHVAETKRLGELLRAGSPATANGSSLRKELLARLDDASVAPPPPVVKPSQDHQPSPEKIAMSHGANGRGFARWGWAAAGLAAVALIGVGIANQWFGGLLEPAASRNVAKQTDHYTDSRPMATPGPDSAESHKAGLRLPPKDGLAMDEGAHPEATASSRPFERVGGLSRAPSGESAGDGEVNGVDMTSLDSEIAKLKTEIAKVQASREKAISDLKKEAETMAEPPPSTANAAFTTAPAAGPEPRSTVIGWADRNQRGDAGGSKGAGKDGSLVMQTTPRIVIQQEEEEDLRLQRGYAGEQYDAIVENPYHLAKGVPLSTFAIDVDTASYANVRRFLNNNQLPPPSAVRLEEMLNYFSYAYPQPEGPHPFSVNLEAAECPWTPGHRLVRVALKGKEVHKAERPSSNLVFLIDTSGSMQEEDKLPLLKSALTVLTRELGLSDRVSIVTYAGDAGLKLAPTSGGEKEKIVATLDGLLSGGSTHGSAGIKLAYEQAKQSFIQGGTNRVILCTDGDLNVGITSDDELVKLITEEAKSGVYLTVLGFGTGNLKDSKMEKLADQGNGVYAYIDGLKEARKVFVEQMSGSLVTIAKDVKIQVEFNPAQVASYRLLGYENRVMANQDFRNDKKDAGEIGAGHTVTALYEIVPVGVEDKPAAPADEPKLRYQKPRTIRPEELEKKTPAATGAGVAEDEAIAKELLTVRLRYKKPDATLEDAATEFETSLSKPGEALRAASEDFRFATAVAMAGLTLRQSEHRGTSNLDAAAEIAVGALGEDPSGWRKEFVELLNKAKSLGR